jgi:FK506-binding protein 4/5
MERDAKFTLGEGCEVSIPDGVEEGLKSMKNGEKAILKLKSRYGYDTEGHVRYGVPPDAELEFEVHLKSYFPVCNTTYSVLNDLHGTVH